MKKILNKLSTYTKYAVFYAACLFAAVLLVTLIAHILTLSIYALGLVLCVGVCVYLYFDKDTL